MIDWARIARKFWEAPTPGWSLSTTTIWQSVTWHSERAANRIDNLGRALAGAGMLATVEQRAEERMMWAVRAKMAEHLRSGWHAGGYK